MTPDDGTRLADARKIDISLFVGKRRTTLPIIFGQSTVTCDARLCQKIINEFKKRRTNFIFITNNYVIFSNI